jgi:hypothetical protein
MSLRKISLAFSAGFLGGLTNSLAVWFFGQAGITAAAGVKIAPVLTPEWLYPRLVWGGIWGLLFVIPLLRRSYFFKGLLYSMGPSLVQMFYVFPVMAGKGQAGLMLGTLTPVFVIFYNTVWGVTAAYWLKLVEK